MNMFFTGLLLVYVCLTVGGLVLFKLGSQKDLSFSLEAGNILLSANYLVVLGLLSYICSFLLYMFLITKLDLGFLLPIATGLVYILTLVAAVTIFKEKLTLPGLIGVSLILAGIILLNLKK